MAVSVIVDVEYYFYQELYPALKRASAAFRKSHYVPNLILSEKTKIETLRELIEQHGMSVEYKLLKCSQCKPYAYDIFIFFKLNLE